ncbi:tRNA (adenine-N1)-methyltransferase [Nanoarchaeota archaeon]
MKILFMKNGNKFFVKDSTKDYHTKYGYIKSGDFKKSKVETNKGVEMYPVDPSFIDLYRKIKRGPQIIPMKDVGLIISETGINKNSKVVDAGTGSGALAFILANIVKNVVSYEVREDFFKIAEDNKKFLKLRNLKLKNKDIYNGIEEKSVDLVTLDLPEPWRAIPPAEKALKKGGFLVSYSPTIPQVMDFVEALSDSFIYLKTSEIIERHWEIDQRKVRPMSQQIGHSGFVSFARKI